MHLNYCFFVDKDYLRTHFTPVMYKYTYYGHACFCVEFNGKKLLFDPFIRPNPLASSIDVAAIAADYIFISHGHGDHIADAVEIALATGAQVVANYEVGSWLERKGCAKVHTMNHGGSWSFDFGQVKMVNAIHSSMLPDGSYGGNPAGFVISAGKNAFYYAGDTALTLDMKLIGEEFSLDFAILPIGDNYTMGPGDACKCASFIGCDRIIGVHFDTFGYIKIDHQQAIAIFKQVGKTLTLLNVGDSVDL